MKHVVKLLGVASLSLTLATPLFANARPTPSEGIAAVQQNTVTVTGQVTDEAGEPIIGANVLIEGTTNQGAITDMDGNFSLKASVGQTLKVSYIGYLSRTVRVTDTKKLNIVLREDTETLDEVVVVGYGTMKKSDLTGSVSSIDTEDMMKRTPSRWAKAYREPQPA